MVSRHTRIDINSVDWEEMRTAYLLGEFRTVSRTARYLGVHGSTIVRQITSLEQRFGRRVFFCNPGGYYPTEFGEELLSATSRAAQDFENLFQTGGPAAAKTSGEGQ